MLQDFDTDDNDYDNAAEKSLEKNQALKTRCENSLNATKVYGVERTSSLKGWLK